MVRQFVLLILILFGFMLSSGTASTTITDCDSDIDIDKTTIDTLLKTTSFKRQKNHADFIEIMGCVWQEKRLVNKYGSLIVENLQAKLADEFSAIYPKGMAKEKAFEAVKNCGGVQGTTPGLTATKAIKCLGQWKVTSFMDTEAKNSY